MAKDHPADLSFWGRGSMSPGTEQEVLAIPDFSRFSLLAKPHVISQRASRENVMPPPGMEALDVQFAVVIRNLPAFPVGVIGFVANPVIVVGGQLVAGGQFENWVVLDRHRETPVLELAFGPDQSVERVLGQARGPGTGEPLHQCAALVGPPLVIFSRRDVGENGFEVGRSGY